MDDGEEPARLPLWIPAAVIIASIALVIAVWTYQAPASASPQATTCPPSGAAIGLASGPPQFTDNNVATYVGGNYLATSH
jgi:hypothetical protein